MVMIDRLVNLLSDLNYAHNLSGVSLIQIATSSMLYV